MVKERSRKSQQLQIRVSPDQKARIQARATEAGMDVSKWVLRRVLPSAAEQFQTLCAQLASEPSARSYALAALNDALAQMTARELAEAIEAAPDTQLSHFDANYVAAMVETAASRKQVAVPTWTAEIAPLDEPWFASSLTSLRLHLLTTSPAAFRRRNLFVDSTIGDRV